MNLDCMINEYGEPDKKACFKLTHTGETVTLPHYNFKACEYYEVYISYIQLIMNIIGNIEIIFCNESENGRPISQLDSFHNRYINDLLRNEYTIDPLSKSQSITFYIRLNEPVIGECVICYTNTNIQNYYSCNTQMEAQHGMCNTCQDRWRASKYPNNCPICRST